MVRYKIMCLASLAGIAFSAVATTAAHAIVPELRECSFVGPTGNYPNIFCAINLGHGEYELLPVRPGQKISFVGKSSGLLSPTFESNGTTITCIADSSTGEIVGAKEVGKLVVTFTGCKYSSFGCTTSGQASGTIVTKSLMGTLGYVLPNTEKAVGFALLPTTGKIIAEFACSIVSVEVEGEVVGQLTETNKLSKTLSLTFNVTSGKQAITKYELSSEPKEMEPILTATILGSTHPATQMSQDTVTLAAGEEVEVKG